LYNESSKAAVAPGAFLSEAVPQGQNVPVGCTQAKSRFATGADWLLVGLVVDAGGCFMVPGLSKCLATAPEASTAAAAASLGAIGLTKSIALALGIFADCGNALR
jgi:hypothetical protein